MNEIYEAQNENSMSEKEILVETKHRPWTLSNITDYSESVQVLAWSKEKIK